MKIKAPRMQKIKAEGFCSMSYGQIAEQFGQIEDKGVIDYLLVDHYNLDVFEKGRLFLSAKNWSQMIMIVLGKT
jgi:hypothetical protein